MKKLLYLFTILILCSCGFKPLYQKNEAPLGQVSVSNDIFVDIIPNREGQILRSILRNKISRASEGAKYTLKVNIDINTSSLGLNIDDVSTRKRLWVNATFVLLEGEKIITQGKAANNVSYSINDNEFITISSKDDEIKKSLQLIADDIKLKISSIL